MDRWSRWRAEGTPSPRSIMPVSRATSPSSRPRAERSSNGWKAARFPVLRLSNSRQRHIMNQSEMMQKMERGDGFIAALDQSGGSTPKALQGYGYAGDEWSGDVEMFDLIHQMRTRIITAP